MENPQREKRILLITAPVVFETDMPYEEACKILEAAGDDPRLKRYTLFITNEFSKTGYSLVGRVTEEERRLVSGIRDGNEDEILLRVRL